MQSCIEEDPPYFQAGLLCKSSRSGTCCSYTRRNAQKWIKNRKKPNWHWILLRARCQRSAQDCRLRLLWSVLWGETRNKCRIGTKKLLTFALGFGILLKLSLRDKRKTEKFDLERLDSSKKNLKKVLDKRFWFWYTKQAVDEQLRTTKSCENSLKTADCTL